MRYYRTYNIVAIVFVVVLAGAVGMVWRFSAPQPADAMPATISTRPVDTPKETPSSVSSGDALLAAVQEMKQGRGLPAESASLYITMDELSVEDNTWTDDGESLPNSPIPSTADFTRQSAVSSNSASGGSSGTATSGSSSGDSDGGGSGTDTSSDTSSVTNPTNTSTGIGGGCHHGSRYLRNSENYNRYLRFIIRGGYRKPSCFANLK